LSVKPVVDASGEVMMCLAILLGDA
jgi:hypothetical protein